MQPQANANPPVTAGPFTAAITGTGESTISCQPMG